MRASAHEYPSRFIHRRGGVSQGKRAAAASLAVVSAAHDINAAFKRLKSEGRFNGKRARRTVLTR